MGKRKITYKTEVLHKTLLKFDANWKLCDLNTVQGIIVRSDGMPVWYGTIYNASDPRAERKAKAQADRQRGNFEAWHARVGRCWFDDQWKKGTAKAVDNARAAAREKCLRSYAPALWRLFGYANADTVALHAEIAAQIALTERAAQDKAESRRAKDYEWHKKRLKMDRESGK